MELKCSLDVPGSILRLFAATLVPFFLENIPTRQMRAPGYLFLVYEAFSRGLSRVMHFPGK